MATREARLNGYYSELRKLIEASNYQKVIKAANKIIGEEPKEVEAWRCKVVAQINLDSFHDALVTTIKSKHTIELAFEKSYCEYRLNKVKEAYDTVCTVTDPKPDLRILELKAQILYRLERYDDCHGVYRDIIRTTSDDYDLERLTNLSAVTVHRDEGDESEEEESYELVYNHACRLLALGQVEKALAKLQQAREECVDFLTKDEATQEEINQEVAIIRVQEGHCLQLLGREKEALSIYNNVLKARPDDSALLSIINNNLVAINQGANVFDSRKRMKVATASGLEHKLTSRQRGTITLNHALLAYHTNQDDVCQSELAALIREFPHLNLEVRVVEAALLGRQGKMGQTRQILSQCAAKYPDHSTSLTLMTAQILLSKGEHSAVCELLGELDIKDRHRQGIVAARVTLLTHLNRREEASTVLREAVEWHRNNKTSAEQLGALWREAADFHLRSGEPATAAASLLALHRLNPADVTTLAQLITAYAQYDTAAAQKMSASLPSASLVAGKLDVVVLEATPGHKHSRKAAQHTSPAPPSRTPGSDSGKKVAEETKAKKKKKRKPKLPKDYNPEVTPDPERWLPRWQRKGFKKRKDRRVKEVMKGTQGISSEAADKFDITKTAGTHRPAAQPISSPSSSTQPRRNMPKKKGGGKKKKGSGW
ncbi:hypothetical protein Pmani_016498 [Petrolisthes manimaculis]|uniref:Signal recognition particle subunit SRP72 n=1 Tax=Petrolisthes manimaculis TaxID=1843537 RepID=A0AAE1U6M3_9EUCA|nr:hypothetical protein Pmani_016498 [Petrolisthes manimaculis]